MKKIIYITGSLDNPFFLNEIEYIRKAFDDVFVITYDGEKTKSNRIAKKYGIRYKKVSMLKDFPKGFTYFLSWLFSKHVIHEAKTIIGTKNTIKKLLYMFYYGVFDSISSSIIKKETEDYNGDVILYSFWLSKGAYSIARNSNRTKVKFTISRAHGYDLYEERNSFAYLPFRNFINNKLDCIAFISNNGYSYFNSNYESTKTSSRKTVLPLGVSKSEWIKQNKNDNCIVFASCSSCIELKRLDLISEFIKTISCCTQKKVRWIHIGDGPLFEKYKDAYIGPTAEVVFLGRKDNSQIRNIYSDYNVDFFINLSDSEGVPVSIMEAMSCGIPCIARDVGGNSEIVNNDNGLLIGNSKMDNDCLLSYSKEIIEIFEDSELYLNKSKQSYRKWYINYNADKNYRSLINLLQIDNKA